MEKATQSKKIKKVIVILFLMMLVEMVVTISVGAETLNRIYTIQLCTMSKKRLAEKVYTKAKKKVNEQGIRIEKIKRYYVVRIGKYKTIKEGRIALKKIKEVFPEAIIVRTYYIPGRIIKPISKKQITGKVTNNNGKKNNKESKGKIKNKAKQNKARKKVAEKHKALKREDRENELRKWIVVLAKEVRTGNYAKADKMIERMLNEYNKSGMLYDWAGNIQLKIGNYKKAQEYYIKAIKLEPNNPHYKTGLGYSYLKEGKARKAIKVFNVSLRQAKKHYLEALIGLARAKKKVNDVEGVIKVYTTLELIDKKTAQKVYKEILN